jgi:inner membrane protease subunit 2
VGFSFFFSRMARALAAVWPLVKGCITGGVLGITVADWCASVVTMDGASMHPTFDPQQAERALVEKRCLYRYDFSRGDVVVIR